MRSPSPEVVAAVEQAERRAVSRLMSVAFTEQAVIERRKTVTRRKGWRFLKAGDRLTLCRESIAGCFRCDLRREETTDAEA